MKYRLPEINDKDILQKYVQEHHNNGETSISASLDLSSSDYTEWVTKIKNNALSGDEQWGKSLLYLCFDGDRLIGLLSVRYELPEVLFEKYGDIVRVVKVGDFSAELCGGTHAPNSSRVGLFKITNETSVGSGVRRIEAVTSFEAYKALKHEEEVVNEVAAALKLKNKKDVTEKVAELVEQETADRKEIEKLTSQLNSLEAKAKMNDVEEVNGVKFLYEHVEKNTKEAKQLVFDYRDSLGSGVIFVTSTFEGKNSYFIGVTKDLNEKGVKAGDLVKAINPILNGRGGGKPDIAQGGAPTLDAIEDAKAAVKAKL